MAHPRSPIAELVHLDEEEIALAAAGALLDPDALGHAATCAGCAERLDLARGLMRIRPLQQSASPERRDALLRRLVAAGAIEAEPESHAFIRLALERDAFAVLNTNTEIRIGRAVATRGLDASQPEQVAFFRRLGGVEVEVHLIRLPRERFHLVVGVAGPPPAQEYRVALHRQQRELACEPAPAFTATFKNLRPDAYRLVVLDGAQPIGVVEVQVESR